jgi:hypothetical protein
MLDWWAGLRMGPRLGIVTGGMGAVAVLAVVAVMLLGSGGEAEEDPIVATPPPTVATATSTPTRTATPEPTDIPRVTPTAIVREPVGQVAQSLQRLIADYGYPDAADFASLRIPVLGMEARVSDKFVEPGSSMPDPTGPAQIVWYDMSEYQTMGGEPGEGRNAIFSGHVDYNAFISYAGVRYRGEGIFYNLDKLQYGDLIEIEYEGETLRYRVLWVRHHSANPELTDWGEIWRGDPNQDQITLYTCGGAFNAASRQYDDRVVVRAVRF